MFESLFGAETPLAVRFFIAFVVVFALIGASAWLIRRFGAARLGGHAARGRQPRIAVIESGAVDGRRQLVLIRRDNVEHLLMIGGPTDVVVEQNIVRGQRAAAEPVARGVAASEPSATWPLAPEPGPRQRPVAVEDTSLQWTLPAEPAPAPGPAFTPTPLPAAPAVRRPAPPRLPDTLAGLAHELARPVPAEQPPAAPRPAPSYEAVRPAAAMPGEPALAPQPSANGGDHNLAEMAQRLEAALRRPAAPPAAPAKPSLATAPRIDSVNGARGKAAASEPAAAPADAGGAALGSLEQEMANLLGRPSGKA